MKHEETVTVGEQNNLSQTMDDIWSLHFPVLCFQRLSYEAFVICVCIFPL